MAKIQVHELARQMGVGDRELMFLLQSIGVQVSSAQADLDESTVLAILQGKTHAPKSLIVREESNRPKTAQIPKSALSRIKIVDKPAAPAKKTDAPPPRSGEARPRPPAEPARTAVVTSEPEEPQKPEAPVPPVPRRIVLPPKRPIVRPPVRTQGAPPPRPAGPPGAPLRPPLPPGRPGVSAQSGRPAPSVYRPAPGAPGARIPGARVPVGAPPRPGGRPLRPGEVPTPVPEDVKSARRKKEEESKKAAAKKTGARPKINAADEVDLRDYVGEYREDTYSDITLPLIDKNATLEEPAGPKTLSKSALRRAGKETRHDDTGKIVEFKKAASDRAGLPVRRRHRQRALRKARGPRARPRSEAPSPGNDGHDQSDAAGADRRRDRPRRSASKPPSSRSKKRWSSPGKRSPTRTRPKA